MIRKTLLAAWIGFALMVGPLAAACASCCPQPEERATVVTAGCCDCGQTLERPSMPEATMSGGSFVPAAVAASIPARTTAAALAPGRPLPTWRAGAPAFSPPSPPTPRRL